MPRKPIEVVQYKLRIREALRRRIERAAKEHGVSANQEMASRLERSFEQESVRKIDLIATQMEKLVQYTAATLATVLRERQERINTSPRMYRLQILSERGDDVIEFDKALADSEATREARRIFYEKIGVEKWLAVTKNVGDDKATRVKDFKDVKEMTVLVPPIQGVFIQPIQSGTEQPKKKE
jgi:hypothetical protein